MTDKDIREAQEALRRVHAILFNLEINTDKEIRHKDIAPIRQIIKQALNQQSKGE